MAHLDNYLSTDALPMAPRDPADTANMAPIHPTETTNIASGTEAAEPILDQVSEANTTEDFNEIPEPHPDWQFNIFLDDISEGVTSEEFEKMKHLFRGHGGFSETTLKGMKSTLDLFSFMRTRRFLSRDNLVYLHTMLYKLGRIDLIKLGVEYANKIGNVIHFYPASSLPENGFRYVKFHVEGRNFRNCTRSYVQGLRARIAAILFIPAEFVLIAGVEPSSSLLITLMIPDIHVTILEELLETGVCFGELKDLSIDIVEINKVYKVGDKIDSENTDSDQQKKLANIYQQLESKTKQLEDSEVERLRISEELGKCKIKVSEIREEHFHDEAILRTLKTVHSDSTNITCPVTLSSQCALKEFETALKKVSTCDKNALRRLIAANTAVVTNRMNDIYRIQQRQLELAVETAQSQLIPLMLQIQQYQFFSEYDADQMDKILLDSFRKLLEAIASEVSVQVEFTFTEELLHILKKISTALRQREKDKLANKYTWDKNDKLTRAMENDQSFFLAGILYKEINESQKVMDGIAVELFIKQCLEEVGRPDLVKKFQHLAEGLKNNTAKPKRKRNASQKQRSGSLTRVTARENSNDQEDQLQLLKKVADQVQKIFDTVQTGKKAFASEFGHKEFGLSFDPPPYTRHPTFLGIV